jgi:hypothetical protein
MHSHQPQELRSSDMASPSNVAIAIFARTVVVARARRRQRGLYTRPLSRRTEIDKLGFIRVQGPPEFLQPLPSTACTRSTSSLHANSMTKSSQ